MELLLDILYINGMRFLVASSQRLAATQETQFRPPCSVLLLRRYHSLKPVKIRWISLTLSLISTQTTLSVQFNQFSKFSHSVISVSSDNWLAQLILIFSQNHMIKVIVNHLSFTLVSGNNIQTLSRSWPVPSETSFANADWSMASNKIFVFSLIKNVYVVFHLLSL